MVRNEDPLQWADASGKYIDKLKSTKNNTNTNSSVQAAEGKLTKDINAVVVCSDFKFFGASTSMNEGEQILYACDRSLKSNSPLIIFAQGGGMRMQSGMLSLYQMPRTIIGISEVRKKNIPVIIIVDVVASGGISASYAAVGDFLIFEGEKSKFMFAGPRVIQGTISEGELPISFQEGTYCVSHGFGDFIIKNRKDTKNTLVKLLNILLKIDTSVNSVSSNETSEDNRTLTKAS
jgi:acetyl-CoA carboxylase carboxyl transferase subunit beta